MRKLLLVSKEIHFLSKTIQQSPKVPFTAEDIKNDVSFVWESVNGATHYFLWIEDEKGNIHPVSNTKLTTQEVECDNGTNCTKKVNLTFTKGRWWVRAEKENGSGVTKSPWKKVPFLDLDVVSVVDRCVQPEALSGDFPNFLWGFFENIGEFSVGPAISAQTLKYDFAKKKAGFNTGVGAGAAFRFYTHVSFLDKEGVKKKLGGGNLPIKKTTKTGLIQVPISNIKEECRAQNLSLVTAETIAAPLFSITPTIYITNPVDEPDLSVEPAILLGLFRDIVNVGEGLI